MRLFFWLYHSLQLPFQQFSLKASKYGRVGPAKFGGEKPEIQLDFWWFMPRMFHILDHLRSLGTISAQSCHVLPLDLATSEDAGLEFAWYQEQICNTWLSHSGASTWLSNSSGNFHRVATFSASSSMQNLRSDNMCTITHHYPTHPTLSQLSILSRCIGTSGASLWPGSPPKQGGGWRHGAHQLAARAPRPESHRFGAEPQVHLAWPWLQPIPTSILQPRYPPKGIAPFPRKTVDLPKVIQNPVK